MQVHWKKTFFHSHTLSETYSTIHLLEMLQGLSPHGMEYVARELEIKLDSNQSTKLYVSGAKNISFIGGRKFKFHIQKKHKRTSHTFTHTQPPNTSTHDNPSLAENGTQGPRQRVCFCPFAIQHLICWNWYMKPRHPCNYRSFT